MADQKLAAIHDVSFLVEQLSYWILELTNLQLLDKVRSLVHFDYFSSQAWFFCIICRCFQIDPSKTEVSKCLWNDVYRLKTHKILMPAVHKIATSRKTKSFGTFCLFFLDSMNLWHYQSNIQKTQRFQISICSLLQAKHLVITQQKNEGVKMVLSYGLQQNASVELHMI